MRAILHAVMEQLKEAVVTVKAKKYDFGTSAYTYLGHAIGSGVVKLGKDKTSAIQAVQHQKPKKMLELSLCSISD